MDYKLYKFYVNGLVKLNGPIFAYYKYLYRAYQNELEI